MRCPSKVAEQIRDVVPEAHWERFDKLISDFSYKPPEEKRICWIRLSTMCNELLPEGLVEDWQFKMISILTTRSIEELKNDLS